MDWLLVLALAVALLGWLRLTWDYWRLVGPERTLSPRPWSGEHEAPLVSIVLPARNEAHQIRPCLESLVAQRYPRLELIAVDDRSDDGTLGILQEFAAQHGNMAAIAGEPLPEGWMGKSWANHQGVAHARGEWLLFTDADTWHHPEALASALAFGLERKLDVVSLFPFLICLTPWEKLIQPAIMFMIAATLPVEALEDPKRPEALANGQFLLVRRDRYEAVGGHAAIRASVADDMSLAMAIKRAGGCIGLPSAVELLRVRMYTNFKEIWKGWSKNLFAGARGDWRLGLAGTLALLLFNVLPFVALAALRPGLAWGIAAVTVALTLVIRGDGLRRFYRLSPLWAIAHPLAFLVISAIFLNSMWRALSGQGPEWKGRTYPGMHQ